MVREEFLEKITYSVQKKDMSVDLLVKRIVRTPGICGGQPRIDGHRIRVRDVVKWFEVLNMNADQIAHDYDLNLSDIYLSLAYYHANRSDLRLEWDKEDALTRKFKAKKYLSFN